MKADWEASRSPGKASRGKGKKNTSSTSTQIVNVFLCLLNRLFRLFCKMTKWDFQIFHILQIGMVPDLPLRKKKSQLSFQPAPFSFSFFLSFFIFLLMGSFQDRKSTREKIYSESELKNAVLSTGFSFLLLNIPICLHIFFSQPLPILSHAVDAYCASA